MQYLLKPWSIYFDFFMAISMRSPAFQIMAFRAFYSLINCFQRHVTLILSDKEGWPCGRGVDLGYEAKNRFMKKNLLYAWLVIQ